MSWRNPLGWRIAFVLAVVLALAAAPAVSAEPAAPACPTRGDQLPGGPVVVQGWVINHREQPVDATRLPDGLQVDAIGSAGRVVSAPVAKNGFFKLVLAPDVWNIRMQLPADWDGIVPIAPRGGLAVTGCTPLGGQPAPYLVVFKIRRLVDVTVRKWEELANGTVQPGANWQITFQPSNDPFAVAQTRTTGTDGAALFTVTPGTWLVYEWYRAGWVPVTPPQLTIALDAYAPAEPASIVIFKNRHR